MFLVDRWRRIRTVRIGFPPAAVDVLHAEFGLFPPCYGPAVLNGFLLRVEGLGYPLGAVTADCPTVSMPDNINCRALLLVIASSFSSVQNLKPLRIESCTVLLLVHLLSKRGVAQAPPLRVAFVGQKILRGGAEQVLPVRVGNEMVA